MSFTRKFWVHDVMLGHYTVWFDILSCLKAMRFLDEYGGSLLCHYGFKLKERLFPLRTKSRSNYIDIAQLINKKGTGILQLIEPIESEIVSRGEVLIDKIRSSKSYPSKEVDAYYKLVDSFIIDEYQKYFGI